MKPFTSDAPLSATTLVRPNRRIAKYSGESNFSAKVANGCAIATAASVERIPPKNAANSVHPSAFAGSPLCAIAYPSQSSGTSSGSPGMRNRMAVNAPPYVPEIYIAVSRMIDGVIAMP